MVFFCIKKRSELLQFSELIIFRTPKPTYSSKVYPNSHIIPLIIFLGNFTRNPEK